MTEPESGCAMETPARTPLHQTTRALRLSALLRIQRSTSWRGITGSENSSSAPFRDRFRTRQSMVEDRPLNTIRPARYVRRLSLLRCSFILKSLFGTARGFYLWVSNGRANLNLLTTLLQLFTTNGLRRVPASHVRGSISSDLEYSPHVRLAGNLGHGSRRCSLDQRVSSIMVSTTCSRFEP